MKYLMTFPILAACLALSLPVYAARRHAAVAPPAVGELSIEFVDVPTARTALLSAGSDAWFELNEVSQQAGAMGRSVRIRRQFGIRIRRVGGVSQATAILTARLDSADGRSSVRIDGRPVGGFPVVIDARSIVGEVTMHTLEIEVGESVSPGPLASSITWEVSTQ